MYALQHSYWLRYSLFLLYFMCYCTLNKLRLVNFIINEHDDDDDDDVNNTNTHMIDLSSSSSSSSSHDDDDDVADWNISKTLRRPSSNFGHISTIFVQIEEETTLHSTEHVSQRCTNKLRVDYSVYWSYNDPTKLAVLTVLRLWNTTGWSKKVSTYSQ